MTREAYEAMIADHVEFHIDDTKTLNYITKRMNKYLKEEYEPATGKDKGIKELCNVLLAYSDAIDDAAMKELDVHEEGFGNIVYDVMRELVGKE